VAIARLVDGDAIDPRAKAGLPAEPVDGPEDAEKDFLREVQCFVAIAKQVHGQLNHHPLVFRDQIRAGHLVAFGAALHKRRLTAADLGPTDDSRLLH